MEPTEHEVLNSTALKKTKARAGVLTILSSASHPLDVAEIQTALHKQHIEADQATVYRILKKFLEHNIIHQIELKEGKFRYELTSLPHHHHLVCEKCGNIDDIAECDVTPFEKTIAKHKQFTVTSHHLEFYGVCGKCQ